MKLPKSLSVSEGEVLIWYLDSFYQIVKGPKSEEFLEALKNNSALIKEQIKNDLQETENCASIKFGIGISLNREAFPDAIINGLKLRFLPLKEETLV